MSRGEHSGKDGTRAAASIAISIAHILYTLKPHYENRFAVVAVFNRQSGPAMLTMRDIGKWLVNWAPGLTSLARKVYGNLPERWHDTPTSRPRAFYAGSARVTFLQIGAYDGIAGDPLRPIISEDERWFGVLVEPQLRAFEQLKRNYRCAARRLFFLNCAFSEKGGEVEFHYVSPETIARSRLPSYYAELASLDRSNINKHDPRIPIETVVINTLTRCRCVGGRGLRQGGLPRARCRGTRGYPSRQHRLHSVGSELHNIRAQAFGDSRYELTAKSVGDLRIQGQDVRSGHDRVESGESLITADQLH